MRLIGYFPRSAAVPELWTAAAHVTEICSVSSCINRAPEGWIDHWLHNALGFYNSFSDAGKVAGGEAGFTSYAYRLLPSRFVDGIRESIAIPELSVEALPHYFESLGFDAVSKSNSDFFECSPLSCNNLAAEIPVNRYCLLDTLDDAVAAAERFSREQPEPGAYYVVEVLRARS